MIKRLRDYTVIHSIWTFYGAIRDFSDYGELLEELERAGNGDHITLYMNSPGGDMAVGESIIRALNNTAAVVHCIIEAPCWSMASVIALCCHDIIFNENTFLMFHDYSTSYKGKGSEIHQMTGIERDTTNNQIFKWCLPFLTEKEYNQLVNGTDIYIKWNDPMLSKRIKRHFGVIRDAQEELLCL